MRFLYSEAGWIKFLNSESIMQLVCNQRIRSRCLNTSECISILRVRTVYIFSPDRILLRYLQLPVSLRRLSLLLWFLTIAFLKTRKLRDFQTLSSNCKTRFRRPQLSADFWNRYSVLRLLKQKPDFILDKYWLLYGQFSRFNLWIIVPFFYLKRYDFIWEG